MATNNLIPMLGVVYDPETACASLTMYHPETGKPETLPLLPQDMVLLVDMLRSFVTLTTDAHVAMAMEVYADGDDGGESEA